MPDDPIALARELRARAAKCVNPDGPVATILRRAADALEALAGVKYLGPLGQDDGTPDFWKRAYDRLLNDFNAHREAAVPHAFPAINSREYMAVDGALCVDLAFAYDSWRDDNEQGRALPVVLARAVMRALPELLAEAGVTSLTGKVPVARRAADREALAGWLATEGPEVGFGDGRTLVGRLFASGLIVPQERLAAERKTLAEQVRYAMQKAPHVWLKPWGDLASSDQESWLGVADRLLASGVVSRVRALMGGRDA